jgi:hypothetical protein
VTALAYQLARLIGPLHGDALRSLTAAKYDQFVAVTKLQRNPRIFRRRRRLLSPAAYTGGPLARQCNRRVGGRAGNCPT